MYDELVKRLRECTAEQNGEKTLWHQAADAIEELQAALDAVNDAHNEGYDVGYWAGRRDYEPKWIPVTERLPEAYTAERNSAAGVPAKTLTYSEDGGYMVAAYTQYGWMFPCYMPKPTHWMPLLPPPIIPAEAEVEK